MKEHSKSYRNPKKNRGINGNGSSQKGGGSDKSKGKSGGMKGGY